MRAACPRSWRAPSAWPAAGALAGGGGAARGHAGRARTEADARALQPIGPHPPPAQMARMLELLRQAKNPMAIVGGSR